MRSIDHESFFNRQLDIGHNYIFETVCIEAAKYFNFSLRETERYGQMMKIAGSAIQKHPGGFPEANAEVFALCYVAPIVLALQMYDIDLYNRFMAGLTPDPMIGILLSPNVGLRVDFLLSRQETYDSESQVINYAGEETPILLSDRLREVYAALFSKPSGRYRREVTIGSMTFEKSTRRCLEEIVSMLSPQSEYQFE
mgnify:FL=1